MALDPLLADPELEKQLYPPQAVRLTADEPRRQAVRSGSYGDVEDDDDATVVAELGLEIERPQLTSAMSAAWRR
jgi:hypothetical protein